MIGIAPVEHRRDGVAPIGRHTDVDEQLISPVRDAASIGIRDRKAGREKVELARTRMVRPNRDPHRRQPPRLARQKPQDAVLGRVTMFEPVYE